MNNEEKILEILAQIQKDQSDMKTEMSDMKTEMSDMNQRLRKVEVTQETTILSRLQLLAEGQTTIQKQIKDISVIDRMQDEIATLKNAVRYLSERIEQLEKAM